MYKLKNTHFSSAAFLGPALAAAVTGDVASQFAKYLLGLAVGRGPRPEIREPEWATPHSVTLQLPAMVLRDFSQVKRGCPILICAPFALHGSTVADFAKGHSLVESLRKQGLRHVFVTDWRSTNPNMRFFSIDNYLNDLNTAVDELGGFVDLVGLCQGGWMAFLFAARFPAKVRKLVLAGAPIDIAAGSSALSRLTDNMPMSLFRDLVALGDGCMLGYRMLDMWGSQLFSREDVYNLLKPASKIDSKEFSTLENRFRNWFAWTVDLPGVYYLQVVEQLYKENRIATGRFIALGKKIDPSSMKIPIFMLAARDDELVAQEQMFAIEQRLPSQCQVHKDIAPCRHLGLFMASDILSKHWWKITQWLSAPEEAVPRRKMARASLSSRKKKLRPTAV